MEADNAANSNYWELLASRVSDGMIFINEDFKPTLINAEAKKLLHLKDEEAKLSDYFAVLNLLIQNKAEIAGSKSVDFIEKRLNLQGTLFPLNDRQGPGKYMLLFKAIDPVTTAQTDDFLIDKSGNALGLIEQVNLALFIFNASGRYISVNPAACQLTGYSAQELLEVNMSELVPPTYRNNFGSFMTHLQEGHFIFVEGRLLHKDGSIREVEVNAQMMSNGHFISFCRDITNKKSSHRTLTESQNKYFWLLEQNSARILIHNSNDTDDSNIPNGPLISNNKEGAEKSEKLLDLFNSYSDQPNLAKNLIVSRVPKSSSNEETNHYPQLFVECWTQFTQEGKTITFLRDITEKKQTELALQKSEQQYRLLFQHNPFPLLVIDLETLGFLDVNAAALNQYEYTREEFLRLTAFDLHPKKYIPVFINAMKLARGGLLNLGYFQHQKKDGTSFDVEIFQHDFLFREKPSVLLIAKDVTQKLKAERELVETTFQLRALSAHLESVREEERASMAREVHDELGQQLFSLKMDISWLNKKLEGVNEPSLQHRSEEALKVVNTTIQTVRKIATELRPSVLDNLGLIAALEWQNKEFNKRSGIHIAFKHSIAEDAIPRNVAVCMFRIYQETLTNVGKHAYAQNIFTQITQINHHIVLTVIDDGRGFDVQSTHGKKTLGLLGMKERALMVGGLCEINSCPGIGTTITVKVPTESNLTKKCAS